MEAQDWRVKSYLRENQLLLRQGRSLLGWTAWGEKRKPSPAWQMPLATSFPLVVLGASPSSEKGHKKLVVQVAEVPLVSPLSLPIQKKPGTSLLYRRLGKTKSEGDILSREQAYGSHQIEFPVQVTQLAAQKPLAVN